MVKLSVAGIPAVHRARATFAPAWITASLLQLGPEITSGRRAFFKAHGAVSTDHSHRDARVEPLDDAEAQRLYALARTGISKPEAYALCRLAAVVRITQVVNGTKGVHVLVPLREVQPGAERHARAA